MFASNLFCNYWLEKKMVQFIQTHLVFKRSDQPLKHTINPITVQRRCEVLLSQVVSRLQCHCQASLHKHSYWVACICLCVVDLFSLLCVGVCDAAARALANHMGASNPNLFLKYAHINIRLQSHALTGHLWGQWWCWNLMPHVYILVLRKLCTRQ